MRRGLTLNIVLFAGKTSDLRNVTEFSVFLILSNR